MQRGESAEKTWPDGEARRVGDGDVDLDLETAAGEDERRVGVVCDMLSFLEKYARDEEVPVPVAVPARALIVRADERVTSYE